MAFFKSKTIRGITYDLDHLDPFCFSLSIGDKQRVVSVRFGCHCFTEAIKEHHTPDFHYLHQGERRAFSIDRHALSKALPNIIARLGARSVYFSQARSYFILRDNPAPAFTGPYLVFFHTIKAKAKGVDVLMNIESAYMKPGMADRASPVKFTTLIEKTALGQTIPRGPQQTIKRK
jgi:hypothetical protein